MNAYCSDALEFLSHAFDSQRALFSYSSRVGDRDEVVNSFAMPVSLRYTINTYLGLAEAQRHGGRIEWLGDVDDRVGEFLALHGPAIANCGDHGLLLALCAATNQPPEVVGRSLDRVEDAVMHSRAARSLNMQELAWMLWGTTAWADEPRAEALAHRSFELIREHFVHPVTGLPRHSVWRYRAHAVSFGSIVYFLRAMHEYARAFDSEEARELFTAGAARVLTLQRDDGAWPWMIDVRTGLPIDVHPIFSVHQDSMAMLFLFPARDYDVAGVEEAIERSFRWNLGHNDLGASLVRSEPCAWFYRSLEREERWPRARRYLRGVGRPPLAYPASTPRVRFNRECRSYHLGWVLYVWSGHATIPGFEANLLL